MPSLGQSGPSHSLLSALETGEAFQVVNVRLGAHHHFEAHDVLVAGRAKPGVAKQPARINRNT